MVETYLEVGDSSAHGALETSRCELRPLAHESLQGTIDVRSKGVGDVGDDGGRVSLVHGWACIGVVGGILDLRLEGTGSLLDWESSEEASIVGADAVAEGGHTAVDGVQVGLNGRCLAWENAGAHGGGEEKELGDGDHVGCWRAGN